MADAVRIVCPNLKCRSMLSVPGQARGKVVRCRKCGMRVNVPPPGSSQSASPAKAGSPASTGSATS